MKKYSFILLAIFFSIYMFGCKKQATTEESQEPVSMEAISTINTNVQPQPEVAPAATKVEATPSAPAVAAKLEPFPPAGPFKPAGKEIQTALKNAGFYNGKIDGKIGPMTKKAIEEFQKANGLQADGKVGPKTWALLSSHLSAESVAALPEKKR